MLAAACSGGNTSPPPPPLPPPPPEVTVSSATLTAAPAQGISGDSATLACTATTSDGSAATTSTNYLGQSAGRVEIRATANATCTATRGNSTRTADALITAQPIVPTIGAVAQLRVGDTGAIPLSAPAGVDSIVARINGGRRGAVVGNTGSLPWTPTQAGSYTLSATSYNNNATAASAPQTVTVLPPLPPPPEQRPLRLRALDVETHPSQRGAASTLRYDLVIGGQRVALPADTTITMTDSTKITVPSGNAIEQLVGLYENGKMVGVLDAFGNEYTHRTQGKTRTLDVDVIQRNKPHFTGESRQAAMYIYTDITVGVQGELLSNKGTIRPIILPEMHYWIRRTPITIEGDLLCTPMPSTLLQGFINAKDALQELEKDMFGRSLVTFNLKTQDAPDSLWINRTVLPNNNIRTTAPSSGNVVNCYREGAAFQGTFYGPSGGIDAFRTENGSGISSVAELLDLAGRVYRGREWPRNNALSIFEDTPIVTTYTPMDKLWRVGPVRIATDAGREFGKLVALPPN